MSSINLGTPNYWPIIDFEEFELPMIIPINASLYTPSELSIWDDVEDIRLVSNRELMFFLRKGNYSQLYYQYFPHSENSGYSSKNNRREKLQKTINRFQNGYVDNINTGNHELQKIATTNNDLFTLTKRGSFVYLNKSELDALSFISFSEVETDLNPDWINQDNIKFEVFHLGRYESLVLVQIIDRKKLLYAVYKDYRKRGADLKFKDFDELTTESCSPISFTLFKDLSGKLIVGLLNDNGLLLLRKKRDDKLLFTLFEKVTFDVDELRDLNHFRISAKRINPDFKEKNIRILILSSSNRIIIYDLDNKKRRILVGQNPESQNIFDADKLKIKRLHDYSIHNLNLVRTFDENGMFIGNVNTSDYYFLLNKELGDAISQYPDISDLTYDEDYS